MTLEELFHEAGERGLTHFSLWHQDGKWNAIATPSTTHHYVTKNGKDIVGVVVALLKELPKAPKRAATKKITATVTPEETETAPLEDMSDSAIAKKSETAEDWLPNPNIPRSAKE